ncbi:hypothetical protein A9Q96_04360 [Rhodobacterales bacterium 52_120_T64]|nr:hypothetical protein A9Q96_04360 [Rhodobacterales bacterium 52_120_T64]
MAITIKEHAVVDGFIKEKDNIKLNELKNEALEQLSEIELLKLTGLKVNLTKKQIELIVELLVKIEAYEQRKGWLFRTKRRTELLMKYT